MHRNVSGVVLRKQECRDFLPLLLQLLCENVGRRPVVTPMPVWLVVMVSSGWVVVMAWRMVVVRRAVAVSHRPTHKGPRHERPSDAGRRRRRCHWPSSRSEHRYSVAQSSRAASQRSKARS